MILLKKIKIIINKFLTHFTLAKLTGALFTIIIVATVKYLISGDFYIEYSDYWSNIIVGLVGWTVNTFIVSWLTEYWGIKGMNFNLKELFYNKHTMNDGDYSPSDVKPKLYHAMESNDGSDPNKPMDKGKGIDTNSYFVDQDMGENENKSMGENESKPMDKGKNIDRTVHPINLGSGSSVEPPMATWSRVFPGVDPASVFFPKTINPGPGFNVPGGEVPIRDEICSHIDYNSHILRQFKTMDLKTALEQRNNNLRYLQFIDQKVSYAQATLLKLPEIPTNQAQYDLRIRILDDLNELNKQKTRTEARTTLLNSRIEFIQINWKKSD